MTYKELEEPMSLKNLKRRSEFFEQGGSESAVSDMPVPSIPPTSNRWSWDQEAERHRQEKWQKEQERLLQEQYRRDQEKLDQEWQQAQQEAVTDGSSYHHQEIKNLEQDSRSIRSISPIAPFQKPTPHWEDQENERRKRKETEETQRRLEEERKRQDEGEQRWQEEERRREKKEQELLRLQEERKKREKQEEERSQQKEEELRWQRKKEVEKEEERRRQEAADQQRREQESKLEQQQQWTKSKSTSELDDMDKSENTVTSIGEQGDASWKKDQRTLSKAELERQKILQDMKKKTQLSTDNSWIRQSSISANTKKDPTASLIRRGESLDNLDTMPRSSWHSLWTPGSTSSILQPTSYSQPNSTVSGLNPTSSYGDNRVGGRPVSATLPYSLSMSSLKLAGGSNPSSWSQHSSDTFSPTPSPGPDSESGLSSLQRNRSVSGKKICTFCDTALGKGAAMIIESLGLCYHLTCFKCIDCKSDLGGSEAGAEVRIRNRQLYCNSCYMRFKYAQPTSM